MLIVILYFAPIRATEEVVERMSAMRSHLLDFRDCGARRLDALFFFLPNNRDTSIPQPT